MIDSFVSLKCSIPVDVICPDVISTNCAYDRSSSPKICHDASVSIVPVNPFAIVTGPAVNPFVNLASLFAVGPTVIFSEIILYPPCYLSLKDPHCPRPNPL